MKKQASLLRKIVPFVKEYSSTRGGESQGLDQNAVYAVLHEKGLVRFNYHFCYGMVKDYKTYRFSSYSKATGEIKNSDPVAILLQVQPKPEDQDEEAYRHWFEWVLNYSPFRDTFISKNVSKVLKDGVVVVDPTTRGLTLGASMIAFRQAWENYYFYAEKRYLRTKIWWELSQKIDPVIAFAISNSLLSPVDDNTKLSFFPTTSGHSPFNQEDVTLINFIRNNNKDDSKPWIDTLSFGGSATLSSIWHGAAKIPSLQRIVKEGLIAINEDKKKVNPFPSEEIPRYKYNEAIDAVATAINNNKDVIYGV